MPSSPNYVRNYKQENKYKKRPDQVKKREERNLSRARAERAGLVHKGDGKDVDHIRPLSKGGSNARSNTRVISRHSNDSYPRTSSGAIKAIGQLGSYKIRKKKK